MQAKDFAILKNKDKLAHAYLFNCDFETQKQLFLNTLSSINVNLNKPGHFIFEKGTFTVDDARNVISWYESGATNNDSEFTVCVIAPDVFKKDAQQLLLKILEEAKRPYIFFIFLKTGTEVIATINSRVIHVILGDNNFSSRTNDFILMPVNEKLGFVQKEIKNMESSEIREYTENLARELIIFYSTNVKENKDILSMLNKVLNSLSYSLIAPKFLLEYLIVKL